MPTRIKLSQNGNTPFEKLVGHNEQVLKGWLKLETVLFTNTGFTNELLEQVRRTLAFGNECEYCMVKGGKPDLMPSDERVEAAITFAQMFVIDHKSINERHFIMLRSCFSESEISELCVFITFITACQQLGKIMNLTEDYQPARVTSMMELKSNT